jgi:filamentous hemagglutinin family protein
MTLTATASTAGYRATQRRQRDLLSRTALCGVLIGAAAALASPAWALPVPGGTPQVNVGGALPTIANNNTETDVTLKGARTVIDWASYNVGVGQTVKYTFDARSWIVLNRIQSAAAPTISGVVEGLVGGTYGGNIWFASRSGMIFGSGAKIDAGGLLISTAAPDLAGFLNTGNLTFNFPGSEVSDSLATKIQMLSGASITGHGGLVALISPSIVTAAGTSVTGLNGSNVLYGVTKGYQLHLVQETAGDFDLVDFIVSDPTLGSANPVALDLQNTTTANSVFAAVVSRASAANAVINLQGLITAQAAATDGGDIILSGGGGIAGRLAGPAAGGSGTDVYLAGLSASRDIQLQNSGSVFGQPWARPANTGPCTNTTCPSTTPAPAGSTGATSGTLLTSVDPSQVSNLTAGRDVQLVTSQSIQLGSATAARNLSTDSSSLQANALTANGALNLKTESGGLDIGALSLVGGGSVQSSGAVQIDKFNVSSSAGQTFAVNAATDLGIGDGSGGATGGTTTLGAGRNVTVNLSSATLGTVTAGGVADLQAGDLTVKTVKGQQILARGGTVALGTATSAGDVYVSASGAATVGTATAGDDVYVLAGSGAASLTNATVTAAAPDAVGPAFAGNPDTAGNGRVVAVQSGSGDALLGLGTGSVTGATVVSAKAGQDATVDVAGTLPSALSVNAARDATLRAPTVTFDAVTAGRDITLTATASDLSTTRALTASRNITIGAAGALQLSDVTAGSGSITLTGKSVTAGAVQAGQDLTLKASSGDVKLTSFEAGEDLTVQGSTLALGTQLAPIGRDLSIAGLGDFATTSNLSAGRNVTVNAPGALQLADISTTSGSIKLTGKSVTAGAVQAGQDLTLTAPSGAVTLSSFKVGEDLSVQSSGLSLGTQLAPVGRDVSISTPGDFTSSSDLAAGRNINVSVGGVANLKGLSGSGTVDIVATDLTLGGTVTAGNVQIESATGALRVGGSAADGAPASGLWLDNAEFGRIHATGLVNLYAGPTAGSARGDLTILALDVNPQSTPQVNFLVGGGHNALVQGAVAPTSPGGIVHIGDASDAAWRPTSILVSGSLGASTYRSGTYSDVRPFNEVRLFSNQDIIIGSSRFIGLVQSATDVDIGHNKPVGVAATASEQNRVMVTANLLEFSAPGKAVSQNTGGTPDQSVGLFLTGTASPKLILDPPTLVDIYGAYVSAAGVVVTSFTAGGGLPILILDSSGNPIAQPDGAVYRFNSCAVGTSQCSGAGAVVANLAQTGPVLVTAANEALGSGLTEEPAAASSSSTSTSSGSGGKTTRPDRNAPPGLLGAAPVEGDEQLTDPVLTGTGSEEIWRQRQREPAPAQPPAAKP